MATFAIDVRFRQGNFSLDLSLRLDARVLALYGPSGAGKSTALELIAGIRTPDEGRIAIDGREYFNSATRWSVPVRERAIGYVPQDVLLFPHMTVGRNVVYGRGNNPARTDWLIDLLELGPLLSRRVDSLSGGERQRVALARALNSSPRVLLLDEPLAAVDLPRRRRIIEALARVRDELGTPIVYVAHAIEEVQALSDVTAILDGGIVTAMGAPADVLS